MTEKCTPTRYLVIRHEHVKKLVIPLVLNFAKILVKESKGMHLKPFFQNCNYIII